MYTQTKKKRPIFMVLNLSVQFRCRNRNKTQNVHQTSDTQKNGNCLILFSDLEELLNLMCTQLFPLSPGSYSSKRDVFYVKWQPVAFNDEKTSKNPKSAY